MERSNHRSQAIEVYIPEPSWGESHPKSMALERAEGCVKGKVLLVEDDVIVQGLLTRALEHRGYEVLRASDGAEALEIFRANPEDVSGIVTDVVMPRMDGLQLAEAVQSLKPGIPIVFISGYADVEKLPEILPAGRFLPKPLDLLSLLEKVDVLMGNKKRDTKGGSG